MRKAFIVALLGAALPTLAFAQSAQDLINDAKNTKDVLTYGMGYGQQRFSPMKQIDRNSVKRLVPQWAYSMADNNGLEAQPLVKDGIIYLSNHNKTVAVDGVTGVEKWRHVIEYKPETTRVVCCGIVNRGVALFDDKVFRTTLDGNVIAIEADTGKDLWKTKAADPKDGFSMTVAPLVANGVVIAGVSGAEFGVRGFLDGYDSKTGERLWRWNAIPGPGEKGNETWAGDSWKTGGGSTWITGSYDPELDLVFWGTGNPAPWNPLGRKGDNLYTNSVVAIKPKTGKMVWHYQFSPNDPYDYDGVNELIHADLNIDGQNRKVIMQANRNGFLYVIERATGKLLRANKFVRVNWAERVDMKTGRPVWSQQTKAILEKGTRQTIWPSLSGGKNWMPMSYSPITKLAYANTMNIGWEYEPLPVEKLKLKVGQRFFGVKRKALLPDPGPRGYLKALDPLTGKAKWAVPFDHPNIAGTLTTAGGVVFTGTLHGEFMAFDADTGSKLWKFRTPSGIVSQPVTWEKDGKQYVTVGSGIGGVYALRAAGPSLAHIPRGASLWTFALMDK